MSQLTKDTANAWGLTDKQVKRIHAWVGEKIDPQWQSRIFVNLLRREYKAGVLEEVPDKLTKEYIESKRHTKAQLAKWGVSWPPPKGWKKRLIRHE